VIRSRNAGDLDRLAALPYVEASTPYHPAFKIERSLGRTPLIQASRARSTTLELMVAAWPGAEREEIDRLRADVEKLLGARAVSDYAGDGTVLRVEAQPAQVSGIAALDSVVAIQEVPEMMLSNSEAPSLLMVGSVEETQGAKPYHDIGLDGGGIDTNGDGQRVNDGFDLVPPQIVAVTDNGLSYDSAHRRRRPNSPCRRSCGRSGGRDRSSWRRRCRCNRARSACRRRDPYAAPRRG